MANIIAIANQKGGVGKTTTTANLGTGLARRGFRVLLVDLDPQANLTAAFGLERGLEESIATSLASREASVPILRIEDSAGITVDVVPSSLDLAAVESALVNKLGREMRLREHLRRLDDQYDYILIDTPPSLGLLTINAMVAADWVVVPTEARFFSMQGLDMLKESINEVLYMNPKLRILGIVLSKYDRRLREETTVNEFLRSTWGDSVFQTEVPTNSKILEASSAGVSIYAYKGTQKAIKIYEDLVEEVVARA